MSKIFSIIYTIVLVLIGCENIYLLQNLQDINVLVVFLSLVFLLIVFISDCKMGSEDISWGLLPITLLAFLLYSAISFYFSFNADMSMYPTFKIIGSLFLTLALLYFLKDIERLKKALLLIFILAGTHAFFGILQQFVPSLLHRHNIFNSTSTSVFTNPNFFSGYLVIHIPLGFYLMSHCNSNIRKIALAALWIMVWVALGFSGSPGGQLLAILQVVALTTYLWLKKDLRNVILLGWSLVIALLIYFVIIKFFIANPRIGDEVIQDAFIRRPWVWEHLENRFMYWTGAWSIFKEHGLLGSGLWTFVELYPQTGLKYTQTGQVCEELLPVISKFSVKRVASSCL
jgi:putative inorganic carbon (hco3(-)) transporter